MPRAARASAPLITALVLLGCVVIYFACYLALVVPLGVGVLRVPAGGISVRGSAAAYRSGDHLCRRVFWPLEQLDRLMRADDWATGDVAREMCRFDEALPYPLQR